MPRITLVSDANLTPEQKPVYDAIVGNKHRGNRLPAPYKVALHSPRFAQILQDMGGMMRYETVFPKRLSELAIIITGRYWTAQYEWYAHKSIALENGLKPAIVQAVADGKRPTGMDADEEAVYNFTTELLNTKQVSDATFEATKKQFGEQGVVDLVGVCGYYTTASMLQNLAYGTISADKAMPMPE